MRIAVITLSSEGLIQARAVAEALSGDVYCHESFAAGSEVKSFAGVIALTAEIFGLYQGLVYIAPCGVVVRAIAPLIRHKLTDPAVVVVDVGGRWAISLLSGHEGGANTLAIDVGNALNAEPIITTTSEAARNLVVGIGCRKGAEADIVVQAVHEGLRQTRAELSQVRYLASADVKRREPGLLRAAEQLGVPLRFISSQEIRNCAFEFTHWDVPTAKLDLPGVAEPAALLAGRRTSLLLKRIIHSGITIAVAKESSMSWE